MYSDTISAEHRNSRGTNHRKARSLRYILKLQLKLPLCSGEANVSTKWRRNRKRLKWIDLKGSEKTVAMDRPRLLRAENMRTVRGVYPQRHRLSKSLDRRKWKAPKPLIDIFQENSWITIVAEIAGFNKDTLKIDVKDQKLTLSAKARDRRYYKSLNLPKVVIPNVMHTAYKNGVLEIKLKKARKEETIKQKAD
jgi:HSP20 family molecular chaperone IbpA